MYKIVVTLTFCNVVIAAGVVIAVVAAVDVAVVVFKQKCSNLQHNLKRNFYRMFYPNFTAVLLQTRYVIHLNRILGH